MSVQVNVVAGTGHGTQEREGGARVEFDGVVLGMAAAPVKRGKPTRTRSPSSDNAGDALKTTDEYGA